MTLAGIAVLAVRYGLVSLFFPASALDKILNFKGAVRQAGELFANHTLAVLMILLGLCIEIAMPLGILAGVADRMAAFILAGYCVLTALLFKQFWRPGDFWEAGDSKARNLFWDFMKNLSLASGFLLITIGLDGEAFSAFLRDPLSSTHPYALALRH